MILISHLFLLLLSSPSFAFLANDVFRTGDSRLFPLFCVDNAAELVDVGVNTSTHHTIINEGVKRSVLKLFGAADQTSQDASLSEVYQARYGECSSPERFLKAVQDVVDGAADMDTLPMIKDDPR